MLIVAGISRVRVFGVVYQPQGGIARFAIAMKSLETCRAVQLEGIGQATKNGLSYVLRD